jgi:hypothetical protein
MREVGYLQELNQDARSTEHKKNTLTYIKGESLNSCFL